MRFRIVTKFNASTPQVGTRYVIEIKTNWWFKWDEMYKGYRVGEADTRYKALEYLMEFKELLKREKRENNKSVYNEVYND